METVEPKKNNWIELAALAVAVGFLIYYVPMDKIIAGVMAAIGLGFVIFWHELGHFLAAKWAGVKVLRFSIGFGLPGVPPIISYRKGLGLSLLRTRNKEYEALLLAAEEGRPAPGLDKIGETEYVLGVLPLGGYVGMLGEDPGDKGERPSDPRAFINKPVGARMVILSAGVLMNVFLGLACYTTVYLRGTTLISPRIGIVSAGSAAYMAGLRPGDEVVAIDGHRDIDFEDIFSASAFSGQGQIVRFEIKRRGVAEPIQVDLKPERRPNEDAPKIGVGFSYNMNLRGSKGFYAPPGLQGSIQGEFAEGDEVTAIGPEGGTPELVSTHEDVDRILTRFADKPVVVVVRRTPKPKKDATGSQPIAPIEVKVTIPPNLVMGLGTRMAIEPIAAIRPGSIADKAGFHVGDRISRVDGLDDFDPLALPRYAFDHAGKSVAFEVVRKESSGDRVVSISAIPDDTTPRPEGVGPREPLDIAGLGLAYPVAPRIIAVDPNSVAAKAGLKPGDVIAEMTISDPAENNGKEERTLKLDPKIPQWQSAFDQMQQRVSKTPVLIRLASSKTKITLLPEPIPGRFSADRGLQFQLMTEPLPPQGLTASLSRGTRKTKEKVLQIYATIRGLVTSRIPTDGLSGPLGIGKIAYGAASMGLDSFIPFIGLLSINLAVLNFLPIAPLDGGQVLLLVFEKVRGRPLPEGAENFVKLAGVGLVLILFVVVTFNDLMKIFFR